LQSACRRFPRRPRIEIRRTSLLGARALLGFAALTLAALSAMPGALLRADEGPDPKTWVIVHGAWGGAWDHKEVATRLEAAGNEVYRPTLTGLGERVHLASPKITLETHIQDILNVFDYEDLRDVVLVGHSYGGMVITAVAHRIPRRIARLVYIDAFLPNDGESMFDLIPEEDRSHLLGLAESQGDGWRVPPFWSDPGKDVPHPLATFRDPVSLGNAEAYEIPATYILTMEPGAETDDFMPSAERARARGWSYHVLRSGHNPQKTIPGRLAELLVTAVQ
jgi:pimeloyl-ACP methyl ester carboxylesterase